MTTPTVYSNVKFERPFTVKGMRTHQPPGDYVIETKETFRWTFPLSWERVAVTKFCRSDDAVWNEGVSRMAFNPRDFYAAMERDRTATADTFSK